MQTTFTLPTETQIAYERRFDAPIDRVWAAHTEPELLRQWMLGPNPETEFLVCEMDVREGGSCRWVWSDEDGRLEIASTVLEVEAPHRLVTEERMSLAGQDPWPATRNTIELSPDGEGTILRTTIEYPSKEARDGAYASGMSEGIEAGFDRIDGVLGV